MDASRVIKGGQRGVGEVIDPMDELTITRMIEACFEALPSAVVQTNFLLAKISDGEPVPMVAASSIAISILATSYSLQTLTYGRPLLYLTANAPALTFASYFARPPADADVDPNNRRKDPWAYGLIPDTNRWLAMVAMVLVSASAMVCHVTTYVLLRKISVLAPFLYWFCPMVL